MKITLFLIVFCLTSVMQGYATYQNPSHDYENKFSDYGKLTPNSANLSNSFSHSQHSRYIENPITIGEYPAPPAKGKLIPIENLPLFSRQDFYIALGCLGVIAGIIAFPFRKSIDICKKLVRYPKKSKLADQPAN